MICPKCQFEVTLDGRCGCTVHAFAPMAPGAQAVALLHRPESPIESGFDDPSPQPLTGCKCSVCGKDVAELPGGHYFKRANPKGETPAVWICTICAAAPPAAAEIERELPALEEGESWVNTKCPHCKEWTVIPTGPAALAATCGQCGKPFNELSALAKQCEGRYPTPGPREEGFPVTYRCGLPAGHAGPCGEPVEDQLPKARAGYPPDEGFTGTQFWKSYCRKWDIEPTSERGEAVWFASRHFTVPPSEDELKLSNEPRQPPRESAHEGPVAWENRPGSTTFFDGTKDPHGVPVNLPDYDHLIHSNPDARAWAKFWIKTWTKLCRDGRNPLHPEADINEAESWMHTWFANAMCAQMDWDHKRHLEYREADKRELDGLRGQLRLLNLCEDHEGIAQSECPLCELEAVETIGTPVYLPFWQRIALMTYLAIMLTLMGALLMWSYHRIFDYGLN